MNQHTPSDIKLVKSKAAVKSYANYNLGAKPAQWQLVDAATGKILAEIKGITHGRTTNFNAYYPDGKRMHASGVTRRELVREAIAELIDKGMYTPASPADQSSPSL